MEIYQYIYIKNHFVGFRKGSGCQRRLEGSVQQIRVAAITRLLQASHVWRQFTGSPDDAGHLRIGKVAALEGFGGRQSGGGTVKVYDFGRQVPRPV